MAELIMNTQASSDEQQVVVFRLEGETYGIDIFRVSEIIRVREITPVPHTKNYLRGLVNLRGKTIPVVDLSLRFGRAESTETDMTRIVILETDMGLVGVLVDEVCEVLKLQTEMLENTPDLVNENGNDFLLAIAKRNDRLITLLDVDKVLAA